MIVLIPTIPHTGTKLVANELFKDFEHNALINKPQNNQKIDDHIFPEKMTRWKQLLSEYPAVIPLRHPILTAVSWERRKRDIGEMCVMWYILVEQIDRFNPLYLPIDSPGRDKYLDSINQSLRLQLTTEWPIVNSVHKSYGSGLNDLTDESKKQVLRLCHNIKEFLQPFYG